MLWWKKLLKTILFVGCYRFMNFKLQVSHLVSITSNIWGTKFRFNGLIPFLPDDLGSVTYKTSLLHLQPRQMTVSIVELSNDFDLIDSDCIPNSFLSEGEDEISSSMLLNWIYDKYSLHCLNQGHEVINCMLYACYVKYRNTDTLCWHCS